MGYYITIQDSDARIPAHNLDEALNRLKALNHDPNAVKHGGSWSRGQKTSTWFSWMPEDYDQTVTSAEDVFKMLGFETHTDDEDMLVLDYYDSKIGDEEQFLNAVKDLFQEGSYIVWRGEDGDVWRWSPEGTKQGKLVFE